MQLDPVTKNLLKNPLYAGFDGLLNRIIQRSLQANTSNNQFNLVYDLSEEYSVQCLKLFLKMRARSAVKQFFPSLAFADDQEFPPLQAADMVAYCGREETENGVGKCKGIIGKRLDLLGSSDSASRPLIHRQGRPLGEAVT